MLPAVCLQDSLSDRPTCSISWSRSVLTSPTAGPVTRDRRTQSALARKNTPAPYELTAGLPHPRGALTGWTRRPSPKGSVAYLPDGEGTEKAGRACVDLKSQPHARITHALPIVHWITLDTYAAAPLTAHIRPHLRDTSQLLPFAVHKPLRQIQGQSQNPGSSPSKSKFGTHRVIDFGQLPFPSFLSLPAALRPAAVCEPTYRATKQLATCPSTLWGSELSCYFHTASP